MCLCTVLGSLWLSGQERQKAAPSSPLAPETRYYPSELIATVGIGWGIQQGAFRGTCSEDFTNGRSLQWLLGLSYSLPLTANWLWGASLVLLHAQLQASYRERTVLTLVSRSDTLSAPAQMRNRARLELSTLLLWGYVRWRPTPWLVLSLGPALGIPLRNRFHHEREPAQESLTLPTGEVMTFPVMTPSTVETGSLPARLSWGGFAHLGVDFVISGSWWTSLGVYAFVPTSALLQPPATLRLPSFSLTLSLGKSW